MKGETLKMLCLLQIYKTHLLEFIEFQEEKLLTVC